MIQEALNARGACALGAQLWVTESGAGAPHPGLPRSASASGATAGCLALAGQLGAWQRDARVRAVAQYTFREDPAYPVGLLEPRLERAYPAYRLVVSLGSVALRRRRGLPGTGRLPVNLR
jgi:hypothetical protein